MIKERSYGIVPLRQQGGVWHVLLIKHRTAGHWTFPKGHPEAGELPQESAARELYEETSLTIAKYLSDSVFKIRYQFYSKGKPIDKTVWFYAAEVTGEVKLQAEEVVESAWKPIQEAEQFLTFETDKATCRKVQEILT